MYAVCCRRSSVKLHRLPDFDKEKKSWLDWSQEIWTASNHLKKQNLSLVLWKCGMFLDGPVQVVLLRRGSEWHSSRTARAPVEEGETQGNLEQACQVCCGSTEFGSSKCIQNTMPLSWGLSRLIALCSLEFRYFWPLDYLYLSVIALQQDRQGLWQTWWRWSCARHLVQIVSKEYL